MSGGDAEWQWRVVGQYYEGILWRRKDILPMPKYMISALIAAYELGSCEWLDNMLNSTCLKNRYR
jgi:hypothetical protein